MFPSPPVGARLRGGEALERRPIAAVAVAEEACDAADRRDGHAGELVDLPIGQPFLEVRDDRPAVDEGLELRGRAEVVEELAALGLGLEAQNRAEKTRLRAGRGARIQVPVVLHRLPGRAVLM